MGCVRCGRRQVDPDSGPSAWRRAVLRGEQVLVCPQCQVEGWTEGLDTCPACGSTRLVKRLGLVECRDCGVAGPPSVAPDPDPDHDRDHDTAHRDGGPAASAPRDALAAEVAAALDRVLGRD